ncbi:MAG: 2,5-diamino-6-(ribosylamino)-4(3H)-pyrimidinone 5'-phosphate reductase [Methanotrichaceae archaeon]
MNRPFVYINSAMSADGKISSIERRQVRISCQKDIERVKQLRAESDAIMVGIGTVLADDPSLRIKSRSLRRTRTDQGLTENPLRIVVDSHARTPPQAQIIGTDCLIVVSKAAPQKRLDQISEKCEIVVAGQNRVNLPELLQILYRKGVKKLMVEGGATLNYSLIEAGLVDEISVYIGPMIIGGEYAPTLVDGAGFRDNYPRLELLSIERLDKGVLLKWRVLS